MRLRMRRSVFGPLLAAMLTLLAVTTEAPAATTTWTYITASDGVRLEAVLIRPETDERVPVLLAYTGYPPRVSSGFRDWALEHGYALASVAIRGTNCSEGIFDFGSPREAQDGKEVVEWLAGRGWSNGRVAMYGDSYTGLTQLPVAALRPKGLVAIAPGQPVTDLYRDVAYPGGIPNVLIPTAFSAAVPFNAARPTLARVGQGDEVCAQAQATRPAYPAGSPSTFIAAHPFDDPEMRSRAPGARIRDIDIPLFTVVAWQDGTLGSRPLPDLARTGGPFHAIVSNGGHGAPLGVWYAQRTQRRLQRFLDFYVRGVDNGFDDLTPIEVWWEAQRAADGDIVPRWTTGLARVPPPQQRQLTLYLGSGHRLTASPGVAGADSYAYVAASGQGLGGPNDAREVDLAGVDQPAWSSAPPETLALPYETKPLERDLAAFGPASLDLFLASTAPDTDLQAVVTEVRPDGNEVYVQDGYLRASHRRLDAARSTPTRPVHTHQAADVQALVPGTAAALRLELRPFAHVFRRGSRLRIWIDAPPVSSALWAFGTLPGPAQNTVFHGSAQPSLLRLGTLPGRAAPVERPACGTVLRQPCRPDPRP